MGHFSKVFSFLNIGQENVFYDIVERKNRFLTYKNKKIEKGEKLRFNPKGLVDSFGKKIGHFSKFLFF